MVKYRTFIYIVLYTLLLISSIESQDINKNIESHESTLESLPLLNNQPSTSTSSSSSSLICNLDTITNYIESNKLENIKLCIPRLSASLLNTYNSRGSTIFLESLWFNQTNIIHYLLSVPSINTSIIDSGGSSPIHIVALNGNLEILMNYKERFNDPHVRDNDGFNIFHLSSSSGYTHFLKYILNEYCNDIEYDVDVSGNIKNNTVKSNNKLLECINILSEDGITPLMFASSNNHMETVKYLISLGADINKSNIYGSNALSWAIQNGHLDMVKYYRSLNVSLNPPGDEVPYIFWAVYKRHHHILDYLLDNGADASLTTSDGKTIIHYACQSLANSMLEKILNLDSKNLKHITVSTLDNEFNTPLHTCAEVGNHYLEILIEHGVDKSLRNKDGKTAADIALHNEHMYIYDLLLGRHVPKVEPTLLSETSETKDDIKEKPFIPLPNAFQPQDTEYKGFYDKHEDVKSEAVKIDNSLLSNVEISEDDLNENWESEAYLKHRDEFEARIKFLQEAEKLNAATKQD